MKTPEKIYLATTKAVQSLDSSFVGVAHSDPQDIVEPVEYTRTDAFIERACEGIEHLLSGYIIRNFHFRDSYEIDTLIEDFKKYMKGE